MTKEILILGGARTPMAEYVGTPGGGKFNDLSAIELGALAVKEAVRRAEVDGAAIDHVVIGNVMQTSVDALYGARHVGLRAGLPIEPAFTWWEAWTTSVRRGRGERPRKPNGLASALSERDPSTAPRRDPYAVPYALYQTQPDSPYQTLHAPGLRHAHCGTGAAHCAPGPLNE